jgi:hypothetical protein
MDSHRSCDRPGCGAGATATLTYHYGGRIAWLDDLAEQQAPSSYDLCARHADSTKVPVGWAREDRRDKIRALFQSPIAS